MCRSMAFSPSNSRSLRTTASSSSQPTFRQRAPLVPVDDRAARQDLDGVSLAVGVHVRGQLVERTVGEVAEKSCWPDLPADQRVSTFLLVVRGALAETAPVEEV